MAAVIKRDAGAAAEIRRFVLPAAAPRVVMPADPLADENAALRAEVARLAGIVEQVRDDMTTAAARTAANTEAAAATAYEDGRRSGRSEADDRASERLAALRSGLEAGAARLDERLAGLDGLAAALARAALAKVFARPEAMAEMVVAALARHVATLRDRANLTVQVSGADFTDPDAVERAAREAGGRAMVTIDPELPAGACRLAARLGHTELDVPAQWTALAALFDGMAAS